jgi:hypothetical protein
MMKNTYTLTVDYIGSNGPETETVQADRMALQHGHFVFYQGQAPDTEVVHSVLMSQVLVLAVQQNPGWVDPNGVQITNTPEPEICPGDPSHYARAHDPGGFWYGTSLDHRAVIQTSEDGGQTA